MKIMEHNEYLNEILFLIETGYSIGNIDNNDLIKINELIDNLSIKRESLVFSYRSYKKLDDTIPNSLAGSYRQTFERKYSNEPIIKKSFKIKSTLLEKTLRINPNLDTVLKFIEYNNKFELAYIAGNEFFVIDCDNQKLIPIDTSEKLKELTNAFYTNIWPKLNTDIISDNTRKISIPFEKNFDDLKIDEDTFIHLYSSVINNPLDSNNNRFTFIMCFGKEEEHEKLRYPNNNLTTSYYDTFQLCPPYPHGQNHC